VRRLRFALGLLLAPLCLAQQPDIRLQVLSLYRIQSAALDPLDGSTLRSCPKCNSIPWKQPLDISARGSLVRNDGDGKTAPALWIDGGARVESDATPPRTLHAPIEVHARSGELVFIERLTVEEYTAAVVQGETSGEMPPEALRAMAVAARTYATRFRERHKAEHFDFCDSTHCQFVNANVSPVVAAAVEQTRGELLWDHGTPLAAYYHQDCGGKTEAARNVWPEAEQTASGGLNDPYCVRVSKPWRAEISRRDLEAALQRSRLRVPRQWQQIRVLRRTPSGRAQTLLLADTSGANGIPLAASSLRFAVGRAMGWSLLKSDLYDVASSSNAIVFTGRGTGHGVGLCQLGAAEMAREGKSYRDILAFYYPGAALGVAASGIAWHKSPSARLDVFTVDDGSAAVQKAAERALAWAESQTRLHAAMRPAIYVFPSVEIFRNATGEPGWVAASTSGNKIRMQPPNVLGARVEPVLRHELVHLLLETNAAPQTPLWFREGMAMLLTGDAPSSAPPMTPQNMDAALSQRSDYKAVQAAYASSLGTVARLEQQYGRVQLLSWLNTGIPAAALDRQGRAQQAAHHP
jgi:stage II sporulation protein D (peptidoglycan lytic transglycosylase)